MTTESAEYHPLLITMREAERLLSLDDNSIRKLLARGEITAIKVGRALRIDYTSVVRYVERKRTHE
jgi:excisionase family DNA binding protein